MKMKTALITGCTGALAKKIAANLHSRGFRLILNYRSSRKEAQKLLSALPGSKLIQTDVTKESDVKKLFKLAGRVDVLINTVGDFFYQPLSKTSAREFTACIENNLYSAWYCIQAVLPGMRQRDYGRIISFGSAGADQLTARPFTAPYYIAKSGLNILTKSLARELQGTNVTVNMVSPGILPTSTIKPRKAAKVKLDDVVRAVVFLIDDTNAINGANIDVTAGWRPE